jgi:hypothetical protein
MENDPVRTVRVPRSGEEIAELLGGLLDADHWKIPDDIAIIFPFALSGFWLWEVKDKDETIAWVKRCPNPMPGPSEIEIRPLYEMADLVAAKP